MTDRDILDGFTRAVSMMELCIAGYCLYRLVRPFLQNTKTALTAGGIYVLTILMIPQQYFGTFMVYAMGSLAAFLVMCRMERRNYPQKAFLAITFYSLRWLTGTMAEVLYDRLYSFVECTTWYRSSPSVSKELIAYFGVCTFYLIMMLTITMGAISCIVKSYAYKYEQMLRRELLILIIPSFLGVVSHKIIHGYRNFYIQESGELPKVYDRLSVFYCGLSVAVIVIMVVAYQNIKAAQEEKTANQLLYVQIDNLKTHIGKVENLYQDICGMSHDMTNHILTLERLYAGSETAQAQEYARELKTVLSRMTADGIKSGNPITDTILQEWKMEAEKRKIRFDSDFYFPAGSVINAFDISVILNNALQNAVENAQGEEEAYLSVHSYHRNNAYMIEINNSFMGTLRRDAESGLPITSKSQTEGHGYGLSNIRKVAKKYFGDIDIVVKDGEFLLSVMLMME